MAKVNDMVKVLITESKGISLKGKLPNEVKTA